MKCEEDGRTYDCDFGTSFGFGTGVTDSTAPGGFVSNIHVVGRSGFGARCSSSNMRSTRAARSSSELKYSIGRACARRRRPAVQFWTAHVLYRRPTVFQRVRLSPRIPANCRYRSASWAGWASAGSTCVYRRGSDTSSPCSGTQRAVRVVVRLADCRSGDRFPARALKKL